MLIYSTHKEETDFTQRNFFKRMKNKSNSVIEEVLKVNK